jgi:hypothetical protein
MGDSEQSPTFTILGSSKWKQENLKSVESEDISSQYPCPKERQTEFIDLFVT